MRRKRYQKPKIKNIEGYWIAQFRDLTGRKRKVSLGPVARTKKYDAEVELARILEPLNTAPSTQPTEWKFGEFFRQCFLPRYERRWKESTLASNKNRMEHHLVRPFDDRLLASFDDDELQAFVDAKANAGLSYSVVAHLRWDLRQIFRLAAAKGAVAVNPAEDLHIPNAYRGDSRVMDFDEVRRFFSVLDPREKAIGGLAIFTGMRPGEIFALKCAHLQSDSASIEQRIYKGKIGSPKTNRSKRLVALGAGVVAWVKAWMEFHPCPSPDAWVFPSEKLTTPVSVDNCWRRSFLPALKSVGLEWANFLVMRRTHSSLLADLEIDPQVRAEQMGHSVDVNQNTYTRVSLNRRQAAVSALEKAAQIM